MDLQQEQKLYGSANYQLIVEYEPVLSSTHVIIKYVEQGNTSNVIETINVGYKQIGSTYEYDVPTTHLNNGLWSLVGEEKARSHTISKTGNEILVYFTKIMADLEINYVEQGNQTNILETINSTAQINTIHTYSAPSQYIDNSGGEWTLVPNTNRITIVERNKYIRYKIY